VSVLLEETSGVAVFTDVRSGACCTRLQWEIAVDVLSVLVKGALAAQPSAGLLSTQCRSLSVHDPGRDSQPLLMLLLSLVLCHATMLLLLLLLLLVSQCVSCHLAGPLRCREGCAAAGRGD
jgi:hypothetical protein